MSHAFDGLAAQSLVPLPLGDVKPSGWLRKDMEVEDSAMGKSEGFYQYLSYADIEWVRRSEDVYTLEGAGSLWFRDMVTIASMLELPTLRSQTEQFLDYYLDTQDSDGWLGPEVNRTSPRRLSGRFPFLQGAMRVADAQPARTGKIVAALHKFVALTNKLIHRGEGLEEDAYAYAGDLLIVLQWLYDVHPDGKEDILAETMRMVASTRDRKVRWVDVFKQVTLGEDRDSPDAGGAFRGMDLAKSLVTLGARTRMPGDQTDYNMIRTAWKDAIRNTGQPLGLLVHDPLIWGLNPLPEWSHTIVEAMRTSQYLYTLTRDPVYADNVDRIFYGTGQFTDWGIGSGSSHCATHSLPNEPYHELFRHCRNAPTRCCTVLYPEGKFDFAYGAFLATPDKTSLIHVHPGPFTVNTTLAQGNRVAVTVNTSYPFSSDVPLTTTIVSEQAFVYYVRIPSGSKGAKISVNESDFSPCILTKDSLHAIQIQPGTTKFVLKLPLNIVTETSPSDNVVVSQGPVLFVYDFSRQPNPDGHGRGLHYAIDPSTLEYSTSMGNMLWVYKNLRMQNTLVAAARSIPSSVQDSLISLSPTASFSAGPITNITLTPYADCVFPHHVVLDLPTLSLDDADP
ncbi:hypothetical protein BC628DRAFT_1422243 [Trametes gibbosa]|nr:hypothetical protein BC628DRAFT_1422243 [Trametes gibbosa]